MTKGISILMMFVLLTLVAACGRQIPEGGLVSEPPAVAEADIDVEEAVTEEADAEEADAEEADAEEADAEEADAEEADAEEADAEEADAEEADAEEAETVMVSGDAANGEALFGQFYTEVSFACSSCHSVDNPTRLVGPSLMGLSERAGDNVAGEDAATYIRNSIIHPNDYIVPADEGGEYAANLMPQTYSDLFSEEELDDLVAYLATL